MEDQIVTLKGSPDLNISSIGSSNEASTDRTAILKNASNALPQSDLDSARREQSVNQVRLPKELQRLTRILLPEELATISQILQNTKQQSTPSSISEASSSAILQILITIANDTDRANSLGERNATPQSIARVLASRVLNADNGKQLAQLLMQSTIQPKNVSNIQPVKESLPPDDLRFSLNPHTTDVTLNENLSQIGNFINKSANSAISTTQSLGTSALNAVSSGWSVITSAGKNIFNALTTYENYKNVGSLIGSASLATISALSNSENWVAAGSAVWGGLKNVGTFVAECCTSPQKLWDVSKSVASFGHGMLETMGILDIGHGIYKLAEGSWNALVGQFQFGASLLSNGFQFITGQQSFDQMTNNLSTSFNSSFGKAIECFKESSVALKGIAVAIGEVTGLADAARCVYYLAQGDYANAAIAGGIAAVSIGAFVWSGGLSSIGVAAAKLGIKQAAKVALTKVAAEGMECLAKETAKEVFEKVVVEVGEHALTKAIERSTSKILTKGITELAENIEHNGIKSLVGTEAKLAVSATFEKYAYQSTKELLADLKVYDHVKESCLELLKTINAKSIDGLEKKLLRSGVSSDAAKNTAQQLRKALQRGVSDDEMIEILAKNITEEISQQILKRSENSFKKSFSAALESRSVAKTDGELGQAIGRLQSAMREKNIALTKQEIDQLVDAGFEGCKRGIKRATREVVERGVKDAFDEFRKSNRRTIPTLALNLSWNSLKANHSTFEQSEGADQILQRSIVSNTEDRALNPGKIKQTISRLNTELDKSTEFSDKEVTG